MLKRKKIANCLIATCFTLVVCLSAGIGFLINMNNSDASGDLGDLPETSIIISAGSDEAYAIVDEKLYAWGQIEGIGTKATPSRISGDWKTVSSGGGRNTTTTLAIKSNGELWAWGYNNNGQVGSGKTSTSGEAPVKISDQTNWVTVSAGNEHSLAINDLGELWAWGLNGSGQLGDGTTARKLIPTRIGTETNWVSISGGENHSLAINSLGELFAWGNNGHGRLGDGTTGNKNRPTKIGSKTNWVTVSAGATHSQAIDELGQLFSWGSGEHGRLGDGTTTNKYVPTKIGTETNWMNVAAGYNFSVATNLLGELWAWGRNERSQLGDGTTTQKTSPIKIGTNTNWMKVSAANSNLGPFTVATNAAGEVFTWGLNHVYQLGLGDTTTRTVPTKLNPFVFKPIVSAPKTETGFTASVPSATTVTEGGAYTFTVTSQAGFSQPRVRLTNTNGIVALSKAVGNVYTFRVSDVVNDIISTDFVVTVTPTK